jgi:putative hemolysin
MESVAVLVILAMVAINAVFAGYEIALASVSVARLQVLVRENRGGAKAALYMKQNMEASLAAVQVGITLVGAIAAATGGAGAKEGIEPLLTERFGLSPFAAGALAIALVVVPLTIVTILVGELVPKVFALRNKEAVCLWLSGSMRLFTFSVWPVVWLFENGVLGIIGWIERRWRGGREPGKKGEAAALQELRAQAALARASRLIGEREEGIILGAARFSTRTVREIMLPAEDISMLDVGESLSASLIAAHLDMHTRFPVTERAGDPQAIIGYVNFKDIVALMRLSHPHKLSLRNVVRAMPSLAETLPIAAGMERMIHEHSHIALVRDAAQRVVGMITLEDILEELVGEIQDEYDRLPAHAVPSGKAWVAGGGVGLGRFRDLTGIDLVADPPPNGARTLSDWIAGHLGRAIRGGDELRRGGLRVLVRKVRRKKALEVQVSRLAEDADDDEAPAAEFEPGL